MKELQFLTIEQLREHVRVDGTTFDTELKRLGRSAENQALRFMDRTVESLYEEFGEVPDDIVSACLLRVGTAFKYREEVSDHKIYRIHYNTWDDILLTYRQADKL